MVAAGGGGVGSFVSSSLQPARNVVDKTIAPNVEIDFAHENMIVALL
jgi:hypothetical protein